MTPPRSSTHPQVLIDQPEDGYAETCGWVEAIVDEYAAREVLAEFCCDEDGNTPFTPTGPAARVLMSPVNPKADGEYQRWMRCTPRTRSAVEFWEIVVA